MTVRAAPETVREARSGNRDGGALVVAFVLLLVIDCVVLGTVHLALLERRLAGNAVAALRLRLAAESAARTAAVPWLPAFDSLTDGGARPLDPAAAPEGVRVHARIERLSAELFLVRAEATEPVPAPGRAEAALLLLPPVLPHGANPAPAALSASGAYVGGVVDAGEVEAGAAHCANGDPAAILLGQADALRLASSATVRGGIGVLDDPLTGEARLARILATAANAADGVLLRFAPAELRFEGAGSGTLVVAGSLTFAAGAAFTGLVVVGGDLLVEEGASVRGAVHAAGHAEIHGTLTFDACSVATAVDRAGLDTPRPHAHRAWIPTF
jgi:hypothetical protein